LEQTTLLSRSEGPKYDASYLAELKASTNSSRPPTDAQNGNDGDIDMTFDASEMDGAVVENLDDLSLLTETITTDTVIPSESAIKAAREKRDRMKKTGVTEDDYISLSVTKREDIFMGPHPESRLMREDDDLGQGDDGKYLFLVYNIISLTLTLTHIYYS
jgi:GC-rich sequence DNA-binding factor